MKEKSINIIGVPISRLVVEGDNLAELILSAIEREGIGLENGDIIVVAHTIVSKAEGRVVHRDNVEVSQRAKEIARGNGFDPVHVELALRESKTVLRQVGALIVESKIGLVGNFAGVDQSNAPPDSFILLPIDPDASAKDLRDRIEEKSRKNVAVIISDTQGRPWRRGGLNIAIGCAGINAFRYERGQIDRFGRTLQRSTVCHVDELAAAAEPVMGQTDEGIPVVIVRGYPFEDGQTACRDISRPSEEDLFR